MRKKVLIIVLISLILFLILPLKAGAETSISYNSSILEVVSDVSDDNNLIADNNSVVEDAVYGKKDRCPPTGKEEQKDKINDIRLALILLIVITAIAVISKFLSDENHRDDNK